MARKKQSDVNEEVNVSEVNTEDSSDMQIEVISKLSMDKSLKTSFAKYPSKEEARYLVDIYYQTQAKRIAIEGQLRSLHQGFDNDLKGSKKSTENKTFLDWYYTNAVIEEDNIRKALEIFSDNNYLSRWAKQVKGIGAVISTCLCAMLEIKEEPDGSTKMHAGSWWNYCGLNDNNRPWLSSVQSKAMVEKCIEDNDGVLDDTAVYLLCDRYGWKFDNYESCKTES